MDSVVSLPSKYRIVTPNTNTAEKFDPCQRESAAAESASLQMTLNTEIFREAAVTSQQSVLEKHCQLLTYKEHKKVMNGDNFWKTRLAEHLFGDFC